MAFLLGTESCIDSLRSDLSDIQETIDEIVVRCGPIKCYSWKSPDKLATDLQIKELLERYQYGKDEVDNQVAHYSLLELIIDRLLLLVHLSGTYIDSSLSAENGDLKTKMNNNNNSKLTHVSAGLAIKKYWNKFTQLLTTVRQLNCQNKSIMAKQKDDLRGSQTNQQSILKTNINTNGKQVSISGRNGSETTDTSFSSNKNNNNISSEVGNKSTQTNETAFVPCESCAKIQTNLKQNADILINMCHYQNIQSQVGKFRASLMGTQLMGGWLSGADSEKWLIEQDKDLNKISKQLEYLTKNNELIKTKLVDNEANLAKMQTAEKELKKTLKDEQDSRSVTMKQYEKKLTDQKNEMQTKILNLENELKSLSDLKRSLDQKYENLKNLHENNEKIISELNDANQIIGLELKEKKDQIQKYQKMEEEMLKAKTELDCLKRELADKQNELNNERSKLEASIRIEQSLKLKQEALLESFDKLTAEKETLRKRLDNIDYEKKNYLDQVESKKEEMNKLEYENEFFKKELTDLKSQLKKCKENELLLLKYPDLYGPLEHLNENELNVLEDMQNQITANKHRINLLENLNKNLLNSLKKLNETQVNSQQNSNNYNMNVSIKENLEMRNDDESYFMRHKESRKNSIQETPKSEERSIGHIFTRPVPLFKLENEINESEYKDKNETISQTDKYWNPEQSFSSTIRDVPSRLKSSSQEQLIDQSRRDTPIRSSSAHKASESPLNSDNDDDYNFLKDKQESDKNFLDKLYQVSKNTELRIESSEIKNRRASSRDHHHTSFLYSPSQASINSGSERNTSSKMSNYSTNSSARHQIRTPIPPAEKNMEIIVGKGRRINSAASGSSARSNSNNKSSLPPTPASKTKTNPNSTTSTNSNNNNTNLNKTRRNSISTKENSFKCDICDKKYDNNKDLDIHKLYCS